MKKSAFSAALLLIGVLVPGCPVYDSNDIGCYDDFDCPYAYVCDAASALCVTEPGVRSGACNEPSDCGSNETCSRSGTCSAGDCHFTSVGCVRGFECSSASGRWECVRETAGSAGAPAQTDGGEPSNNGGAPSDNGGAPNDSGGAPIDNGGAGGG
jgi:hypothetical protein